MPSPSIQSTANLHRNAHRQPNTTTPKQRRRRTIINAQVKVDICTVLVSPAQPVLRAKRVAIGRTQVVDPDDDGVCAVERVSGRVGLRREFVAEAAGGTCACAGAGAEEVL